MNIPSMPAVSRGAFCAAAVFALSIIAVRFLRAADRPGPAPAVVAKNTGNLSHDLLGVWVCLGAPGNTEEPPAKGGFIKLRTADHLAAIAIDPRTGLVTSTHGGTWRVEGNVYQESIEFGGEHHAQLMNRTFKWNVKLDGNNMTMTPLDNPWNEVWQRVK